MMGEDWVDVAQDRDQWRVRVNSAMKLPAPYIVGDFSKSWADVFARTELLRIG
jgi:hypothetical protein